MRIRMLNCMPSISASTSVRIDRSTHEELKRLAEELGTTVGEAVAIAARRLRQQRIGLELRAALTEEETDWLDADLG
jgi:antitoxin component of RelBE/YafQ-DinJ toxin-antitoxin module